MSSRFNELMNKFCDRLVDNAGVHVSIERSGDTLLTTDAIQGKTKIEYMTDAGVRASNDVFDFVVPVKSGWIPERGDRVVYNGRSYIVRPIDAEWWRYDDSEKVFLRVHTQLEVKTQ